MACAAEVEVERLEEVLTELGEEVSSHEDR